MPAPLTTRDIKRRKGSDELQSLKRRVVGLARLDRDVVHLEEGPVLVRLRRLRDAPLAVKTLRQKGRLDRATLEAVAELESPPFPLDRPLLGALEHDLAIIASPATRAFAREHRRAFVRYDGLDQEWRDERAARLHALQTTRPPERWTDAVVELVRALRGDDEALAAERAFAELDAQPSVRRDEAMERLFAIAHAMETGIAPSGERSDERHDRTNITLMFERLEAARDFPGRAKKRRMLDVLRRAIGWPELPASLVGDDFLESGLRAVAKWPVARDERAIEQFATLALLFRIGDDVALSCENVNLPSVMLLHEHDLTMRQAIEVTEVTAKQGHDGKRAIAKLVAAGLELMLLRTAHENKQIDSVATLDDVRSARAFIVWSSRLRDHYKEHEMELEITPQLFKSLPKNEDLSVLTFCLLDQYAEPSSDPVGTLDATLGLFKRLPGRANALLAELRGSVAGEGRAHDPAFAKWLDDDALLDRSIHIARLAGEPLVSALIREDWSRTERRERERKHLSGLASRTALQQSRLDALISDANDGGLPRRERTIRRLRARIERLLPKAYRRRLDQTFRQLFRQGWGIRLVNLTPAWREAARFWLLVDDNRSLLEKLLKEAALRPGQSVKDAFPANEKWLASMRSQVNVDAWIAPRKKTYEHAGARYVIELEEDPLEVLRMGIPFATCLALATGCNAASTVVNAIDTNKRVLYVRNEAGKIVGRKLLALNDLGRIVGYRLYRSVGEEEERALRDAVAVFCTELAAECGAPLASSSSPPRNLNDGFWYDDGEVAFESDQGALPSFCEAHGLELVATAHHDEALQNEAEAWVARQNGDVEHALRVLQSSNDSPAMRVHDVWTVEHLGLRRALREASSDSTVAFALCHAVAVDEAGLITMLDMVSRLPNLRGTHAIDSVLQRFPPSPKTTAALAELALRASRARGEAENGVVHLTLRELPARFEDVVGALDLLDAVEPAWASLVARRKSCEDCVGPAETRAAEIVEALYEEAPDPDVIVSTLMNRHRGRHAHRAALRVAARHVLPGGDRALQRFIALRPELWKTPDGLAALLRQGATGSAVVPEESPFEALRDLVARPDVHRFLGSWDTLEGEPKSSWEAAWRRRRRHDPAGGYDAVLVEEARKALIQPSSSDAERHAARELILDAKDGEVVDWQRLVATAARLGDEETACRVINEVILRQDRVRPFPVRVVVDLWRLGERARDAVVTTFVRTQRDEWSSRVQAAIREASSRGIDVDGMLEPIALELARSSDVSEVVSPNTTEQLERVLAAILRECTPKQIATVFVNLEDALSVLVFRDGLGRQSADRVSEIKAEIRKLDIDGDRTRTFFAWIRGISGIETA